ncbi:MAG: radical SAM protein [Oscillospiraceae bacterium]|nr:radical SAM protein [Oscillospiraceae bacterium]
MLKTKRMSIVPTFACTLRCKLCSNHMPLFQNPPRATAEEMKTDIDSLFTLFDHIEWLQFVGGEIFTHRHLDEVFLYCKNYSAQFDRLIIETNATILPTDKELESLLSYGEKLKVMISDYGELSKVRNQFVEILTQNNVEYNLKKYHGDVMGQHFGGWIDNTPCRDLLEPDEYVTQQAARCAQVRLENMHIFRGKLHRCSNSLFLSELGVCVPNRGDFVDLYDGTSQEEKREIIKRFYAYPRKSCHYCTWKSGDSAERYSAAEQEARSNDA